MDKNNASNAVCLRCRHSGVFRRPGYDDYHRDLYAKRNYVRTRATDPQMRAVLEGVSIASSDRVLDIGCGVGDYTREIARLTDDVTGIDLSIDAATGKYPEIRFRQHDCNDPLPFSDASIDVVVSINVIEHLVDHERFLSECRRVLTIGGRIALTTANLGFFLHDFHYDGTHVHEWTLDEFKAIVAKHFSVTLVRKDSSMFNYYPFNRLLTKVLKPDLLFIGRKEPARSDLG